MGSFAVLSKIWPFILVYLLIRYIFNQLFGGNKKTQNSVNSNYNNDDDDDPNVIDVEYKEVE